MKSTVSFTDFVDGFNVMGRGDQFSYKGLAALFNYLEEYEEGMGEELEFDVVALCCDYTEYSSALEAIQDYCCNEDEDAMAWLQDRTTVIEFDGGVIVTTF